MYLTKVTLTPQQRPVMDIIANPQKLHGMIESSFEGPRARRLWRLDALQNAYALYIQTESEGDFSSLSQQLRSLSVQTASMDAFLARLQAGQVWHFRLRANPTYQISQPEKRGRLCAHVTVEHQRQWLLRQSEKWGATVVDEAFDVVENRWLHFRKRGASRPVKILTVTYEGILQIDNAEVLRSVLEKGIGRGKAYGCGLMTLARP